MPQSQPPSLRKRFQSTPSVGRATTTGMKQQQKMSHFNPRPPWGGRRISPGRQAGRGHFNPRPPWGGRPKRRRFADPAKNFNPRPPWGGRPSTASKNKRVHKISIHALRGEGDLSAVCCFSAYKHFNPRPPWGGRQRCLRLLICLIYFNPRPPWGGRPSLLLLLSL